jgi:hypothetical protein
MKLKRMGRGQFRSFMPEVISPLRRAMTTADQSRSCTSRLRCSSSRWNSVSATASALWRSGASSAEGRLAGNSGRARTGEWRMTGCCVSAWS